MFVVATIFPVNLGALALLGAFLVGTLAAGMDTDAILDAFPGSLFVILVGVTLLFAIATSNGTVDWLVRAAVHLIRGRLAAIPLTVFAVSALLTAVAAIGIPLLVALLICYVGGVVSAFASTVGILGALVPLAVPLLSQARSGRSR
nr:hypothetical protein [Nonomuraea sp. FMUSA5-5]